MTSDDSGIRQAARVWTESVSVLRQSRGPALRSDIAQKGSIATISRAAASGIHILCGTRLALLLLHSIYLYRQLVLIILLSDFRGGCLG